MKRKKWGLVIYMACGIAISYLVRVNISHAIIPIAEEYSLNEVQQGMLLSAFAWGYVALMFIGGILVDKFGALKMSFRSAIAYIIYKTGGFKVALLASGIISCIGAFSYIFVVGKLEAIDIGN